MTADDVHGPSPLPYLLHALNQPLTGLQCSLELALSGPRATEQYVHCLRDGLELSERMRTLVEAIRELVDLEQSEPEIAEAMDLRKLLHETVRELEPVAESKCVRLVMECPCALPVSAGRQGTTTAMFRLLESALSLASPAHPLLIQAAREGEQVCVGIAWQGAGKATPASALSRPELGLLLAQASLCRAGMDWVRDSSEDREQITVRLPTQRR